MANADIRELVTRSDILECPGVHDPLTARVAAAVGFDAIYMTGWGTSIAKTGYPDAGFATLSEMTDNASNIAEHVDVPVLADADDGYGNAVSVVRTVREYAKTGVAGIHIEDLVAPKGAGSVRSKELIPFEAAVAKYRAAVGTRDELDSDLLIIGRTDAAGAEGGSIEEAVRRANASADAGVDVVFVVGQSTEEAVRTIGDEVDAPLLYDCGGSHPHLDATTLEEYGYDIVIYPTVSTLETIHSVHNRMQSLSERGVEAVSELETAIGETEGIDVDEVTGLTQAQDWERQYLDEK